MLGSDTLANVDMERLLAWLGSVFLPILVEVQFFMAMGFEPSFIQRFYKKHARVRLFNGNIARGVLRPFADQWDARDTVTTTAVAQQSLDALAAMESSCRQADSSMHAPDTSIQTAATEAGARS